ncbi:unnamed protein product [Adineta steineri]|uniref:Major facilitator superfamily (MFS) profile domain-containing protein n=1 Tax=Adineta steineri TaxID=433720 RepID=A0A818PBQ9_9BILA|nr:unnamed protein product [Adineta steineri]CAF3620837.1 unnamed protein product [Adineta steineri]
MRSRINYQIYTTAVFAAIGGFLFGYDLGVISGVIVMSKFLLVFGDQTSINRGSLTSSIAGSIVGVMSIGCFIGALLAGQASDRFSRKYSILLFSVIFIVSGALQAGSFNLNMLLVSRLIAGISVGALSMIVPVYQSEISTKEIRGRLVSFQQLAITIGIAVSFWTNYGTDLYFPSSNASWQIPLGLQIVPAFILAIGIPFFPFSPRWLMAQGRDGEAFAVLSQIRSCSQRDILIEYNEIKQEIAAEHEQSIRSYAQLWHFPLRRRLILGLGIQILQQLTGINSIMYYAPEIFKQAGLSGQRAALLATGINGCINTLATIPAILFLDKWGRRPVLIAGGILMSLSMLTIGSIMGIHGHTLFNSTTNIAEVIIPSQTASYTIIVFVYIFVAAFASSWGPTTWLYCTEIFPLSMRAKGTSLTTAAIWATNCLVSFLVPVLLERLTYGTYLIFGIFCLIMAIIIFLFYPETKAHGHSYIPLKNTNLIGQTIVITGAALGIGRVSAVEFARLGAKVIIGIRGQERSDEIAQELEREANIIGMNRIIGYNLDLSNLMTVKNFADKILEHEENVNILLNNAGIANLSHSLTIDGIQTEFGTNHIGHFYLTKRLLPLLIQSQARIVNVSSIGHCFIENGINYDSSSSAYVPKVAYDQSKLAQILHAFELQQRYGQQGIKAYSLHPRLIYTGITRRIPTCFALIYHLILLIVGKSLYQGTQTSLYCSLSDKAKPGMFHADCKEAKASPLAYNIKLAEECWNFSENIINEKTKFF